MLKEHVQVFKKGHKLYPEGRVFWTYQVDENSQPVSEEKTLEQWAELQQQQQSS